MENNMKTMRAANIIEKDVILNVDETIAAEMEFYELVLKKFRSKYGDLIEFESKIANAELPEHPNWEKSIEYRNAYEELESLKRMKGVNAAKTFIREYDFAETAENLRTKIKIVLKGNCFMDMYYNRTLGKYAYTLIKPIFATMNKKTLSTDHTNFQICSTSS
ncbi:MAG: hypothetical protein C4B59_01785 [Candidatus Methanogaster sp.]|uniref:Uncharacterized protein n=1 Tax=Candidatus Methanogaster sp. TaxID=3386292 RepID=A0AC61L6D3_9EURY|nr:MAG: hypothetical protein C4B59_01785 [ANME-2 cluster archaeon]